ncbi:hypothetical protein D3C81_2008690 [compost metagenome]
MLGKAGLLLVQVHRHQLERHRRFFLQLQQQVQQRVAVLATGQADHHLVAGLDHAEVGNRLPHLAPQPLAELVQPAFGRAWVAGARHRIGQGKGSTHQGHSTGWRVPLSPVIATVYAQRPWRP